MKKNSFINLDSLKLFRTFSRVNGDRSANDLVRDFNRLMFTVKYVDLTERVALNLTSILERYRREFEKANADGKDEIIAHIENVITKIGAQDYVPAKYNEKEYKYWCEVRTERGETKAVEILDYIFSVNENEGGNHVSAPVNTNTPTQKNTKSTIEWLGLKPWTQKIVGLEDCISYFNGLLRGCKDIPLYETFKSELFDEFDKIRWRVYRSGATGAMAFVGHIQEIQDKLNDFNGRNLYWEFKDYEETAFNNLKERIRTTDTHDELKTLREDFNTFCWVYRGSEDTPKYDEAYRQINSKLWHLETNVRIRA